MISYAQSIKAFEQMSYSQKKDKVLAMLQVLREEGNIFQDLWDLMHINDDVSETIVDMIYQVITKAMYSVKEQEMEQAVDRLERVRTRMAGIKEIEDMENSGADDILSKI